MKKILSILIAFTVSLILISTSNAQQPKTKVTMGIHLDYFFSGDDGGIKAKDVTEGRAAQKAGVKSNDVILAIDDVKVKGLFHYRDLLSTYTKGQKVKLKVKRNDKIIYLDLIFE